MKTAAPAVGYLVREAGLLLLWSYGLLVGGTINSLFAFPVQLASAGLAAGLLGAWLVWQWRRGARLPALGVEAAALVFIGAQLAAALLGQDVRRGLPLAAQSIAYLLIFYCAVTLMRAGWPAELVEKTLLIAGGIVIGLGLLEIARAGVSWLDQTLGAPLAPSFAYRLYAPLGDANLVAACLVVLSPAAAARALSTARRLPRMMLWAWLAGAAVVVPFTASRGGQAGLLAAGGVLAVLWVAVVSAPARDRVRRAWKLARARPWLLMLAATAVVLAGAGLVWRLVSFRGSATQAPTLLARSEFWPAALNAFQESPLWGKGPGTYPSEYMRFNSTPPGRVYLHAHSVTLNTAAEAGLLGLGATLGVVIALGRALWRARRRADLAGRARWAAAAAAGVGVLVHSQVDDHTRYLAVALPLIALLAGALAEAPETEAPRRSFALAWLILPGLAGLVFSGYSLRATALSEQAVLAGGRGDWAAAAAGFDAAAAADPALAFYWEQAGYAYGRLASAGDKAAAVEAVARLERAAALEPRYAVPYANLAAVRWQVGERAAALAALRTAAQLAPDEPDFQLNLGLYAEALDPASAEAAAAYRRVLALSPIAAGAGWWSATPLRQAVLAEWSAARSPTLRPLLDQVRARIAAGQTAVAERELLEAWAANDQPLRVYVGLAEVARAEGDLELAEQRLRLALTVPTVDAAQQVDALLTGAEIAAQRGDADTALWQYQAVYAAVTEYGSLGWGSAGWDPHAFFAFQRRALPLDLLPALARSRFSLELGRRLLPLGGLYEARGEQAQAAAIYRRLLTMEPALVEAQAALARLGEAGAP